MKYTVEMSYTFEAEDFFEANLLQQEIEDDLDEMCAEFNFKIQSSNLVEQNPSATF